MGDEKNFLVDLDMHLVTGLSRLGFYDEEYR